MRKKTPRYQSGKEIKTGDLVRFHGEPAEVEIVVTRSTGDAAIDWYLENEGPGVMIRECRVFGRAYLNRPDKAEDLVFVSRRPPKNPGSS